MSKQLVLKPETKVTQKGTTALYRISSGEVVKISTKGQRFTDRDSTFWGVLTNPTLVDGSQDRPYRKLGTAKIVDGHQVRNATQEEIDGFQAAEDRDESVQDAAQCCEWMDTHPVFRKLIKALLRILERELMGKTNARVNRLAAEVETLKRELAASRGLNSFKGKISLGPDLKETRPVAVLVEDLKAQVEHQD